MKKKIVLIVLAVVVVCAVVLGVVLSQNKPAPAPEPTAAPVEATEAPAEEATEAPAEEATEAPAEEATEAPAEEASAPAAEGNAVPYDGSAVTVSFYHTMGTNLTPVLDQAIADFNKLFPNITVQYTAVGSYDDVRDQISTEIYAGNQPNVAYCYPDHVAMYNLAKAVVTLDDYIDSKAEIAHADGTTEIMGLTDEQKADFIEAYYEEGRQYGDGLMYTIPMSKSTEVLYYNKTFFEENNIEVPNTWDELEAVCKKIKEIDPNSIPLGYDSEGNWFITMTEQLNTPYTSATGDHYLFDTPENHDFVKRFVEWYRNGYVTTQALYGSYTSGLFTATSDPHSYMSIGSSAGATHQRPTANADGSYPFEVGISTIPQVSDENRKVISQGPSLCIFNKSNPQEVAATWLFVKFLATDVTFQASFSVESGYIPVIKSVNENEDYAAFLESADGGDFIAALSVKVGLAQEADYFTSPAFVGSTTARDQVGSLMTKCLAGEGDIDSMITKAFQDAIDECEYGD